MRLFPSLLALGFLTIAGQVGATSFNPCQDLVDRLLLADTQLTFERQSPSGDNFFLKYGTPAADVSVSCAVERPDISVYWDNDRPTLPLMKLVGFAGALLSKQPAMAIEKAAQRCRAQALKEPESATAELSDLIIDCQVFSRDGGGSSYSLFQQ